MCWEPAFSPLQYALSDQLIQLYTDLAVDECMETIREEPFFNHSEMGRLEVPYCSSSNPLGSRL